MVKIIAMLDKENAIGIPINILTKRAANKTRLIVITLIKVYFLEVQNENHE